MKPFEALEIALFNAAMCGDNPKSKVPGYIINKMPSVVRDALKKLTSKDLWVNEDEIRRLVGK